MDKPAALLWISRVELVDPRVDGRWCLSLIVAGMIFELIDNRLTLLRNLVLFVGVNCCEQVCEFQVVSQFDCGAVWDSPGSEGALMLDTRLVLAALVAIVGAVIVGIAANRRGVTAQAGSYWR